MPATIKRGEGSVEDALIEMYLAGVSVRRVENITEALWGTRVSPSTVSNLNQKLYGRIDKWLNAPIKGQYTYVYLALSGSNAAGAAKLKISVCLVP